MEILKLKVENLILQHKESIKYAVKETLKDMESYILNRKPDKTKQSKFKDFNLTSREKDVSILLCEGLLQKQIAGKLNISENTVKTYVRKIYKKTNVNTKIELKNILEN